MPLLSLGGARRPLHPLVHVLLLALAPVSLGCASNASLMKQGIAEGIAVGIAMEEKALREAKDPNARAYLAGLLHCSKTAAMPETDFSEASVARSPYGLCFDAHEKDQLRTLGARAEQEKDRSKRNGLLAMVRCIELRRAKSFMSPFPYKTIDACIEAEQPSGASLALADAASEDTPAGWLAFLDEHPDQEITLAVARQVIRAAGLSASELQGSLDERIAARQPAALGDLPAERRVLLVGPKGMRVKEIRQMEGAGVAGGVVLARIRASTEPYKNFDLDELGALKKLGIADELVTAMIEVTTKVGERRKETEERQALRDEVAALRAMIEAKKAGGEGSGEVVQTEDGPMDVLASCAKRLGAMKLCEQIPFPGSTLCQATAESSFPCPRR